MKQHYTIKAAVAVDVELAVSAESEEAAAEIFRRCLVMSADLVDVPEGTDYDVSEDSIADVEVVDVAKAHDD